MTDLRASVATATCGVRDQLCRGRGAPAAALANWFSSRLLATCTATANGIEGVCHVVLVHVTHLGYGRDGLALISQAPHLCVTARCMCF